jgi:hypothetical protein
MQVVRLVDTNKLVCLSTDSVHIKLRYYLCYQVCNVKVRTAIFMRVTGMYLVLMISGCLLLFSYYY